MKIQWDGKPLPTAPSSPASDPSRGVNAPRFSEALKSALGTERPAAAGTSPALKGIEGLRPPMEISLPAIRDLEMAPIVNLAETMLSRLENFVDQLADSKVDLRFLGPVVEELSARKDELGSAYGRLPDTHPLKEIVGDLLETVFSALGQFQRGDFGS